MAVCWKGDPCSMCKSKAKGKPFVTLWGSSTMSSHKIKELLKIDFTLTREKEMAQSIKTIQKLWLLNGMTQHRHTLRSRHITAHHDTPRHPQAPCLTINQCSLHYPRPNQRGKALCPAPASLINAFFFFLFGIYAIVATVK